MKNYTAFPTADPDTLTPHPDNPNIHPASQIEALCEVIRENGWRSPVVVSKRSGYIIKGHGRLLAAKALKCQVPVEYQDYPDEATEMRDLVADNKIAELSMLSDEKCAEIRARFKDAAKGWGDSTSDGSLMAKQFGKLEDKKPQKMKFPILIIQSQEEYDLFQRLKSQLAAPSTSDASAFSAILNKAADSQPHEFIREKAAQSESTQEYENFVDKFKTALTTDDCYTPENIYQAVADFVASHYNRDRSKFVRPFYPGGDFERADYPDGCTVVDNPPFSILAQILQFYNSRNIQYFLFAPGLTLFSSPSAAKQTNFLPIGSAITYANGAKVNTSFATSLGEFLVETSPELYNTLKAIDDANRKEQTAELNKYEFPIAVATAARLAWLSKHDTAFRLRREDAVFIRRLDAQPKDEAIFGSALLLSERAAAERAAAERAAARVYALSEREIAIQKSLPTLHGAAPLAAQP